MELFEEERQAECFQVKLKHLLLEALEESKKEEHAVSNSFDLIAIIGYALYSLILPLLVLVSLFNMYIDTLNTREGLL